MEGGRRPHMRKLCICGVAFFSVCAWVHRLSFPCINFFFEGMLVYSSLDAWHRGLGQAEARTWELHLGLPNGCQCHRNLNHHLVPPRGHSYRKWNIQNSNQALLRKCGCLKCWLYLPCCSTHLLLLWKRETAYEWMSVGTPGWWFIPQLGAIVRAGAAQSEFELMWPSDSRCSSSNLD